MVVGVGEVFEPVLAGAKRRLGDLVRHLPVGASVAPLEVEAGARQLEAAVRHDA